MKFLRVHKSLFPSQETKQETSSFAPRSFGIQAKQTSSAPPTQTEIENQAFAQKKMEATKLEIQAKYGTMTPEGQERLGVLQAKMNDFWVQRLEQGQKMPNLLDKPGLFTPRQNIAPAIQPQLTIGEPGDKYEQEADRVAADVVSRMHQPQNQKIQRQEREEELQMQPMIQRLPSEAGMTATADLETSIQQARGGGQPLAESIKEPMEQAFGSDFSGVKVHTDAQSDQLNQSIQAKAFTTGKDVFFRQGEYNPESRAGQELIAHELTHLVQQSGSAVQRQPDNKQEINLQHIVSRQMEVVQRAGGLPTAEEFTDKAGKAGLASNPLKGKTAYGRVISSLKKYQQIKEDSLEQRDNKLSDLMTHISTWQNSKSRNNKKKGDEQKAKELNALHDLVYKQRQLVKSFQIDPQKFTDYTIDAQLPKTEEDLKKIAEKSQYKHLKKIGNIYHNDYNKESQSSKDKASSAARWEVRYLNEAIQKRFNALENLKAKKQGATIEELKELQQELNNYIQEYELRVSRLEDAEIKYIYNENTKQLELDESQFTNYKVKYLSEPERKDYELKLGSTIKQKDKPYNTDKSFTWFSGRGWAIYVMDPNGQFYAAPHKIGKFHHSSFLSGGAVAGAGELKVEQGKLKEINNKSGHYTPDDENMLQTLKHLKKNGVDLNIPLKKVIPGTTRDQEYPGGANKFLADEEAKAKGKK